MSFDAQECDKDIVLEDEEPPCEKIAEKGIAHQSSITCVLCESKFLYLEYLLHLQMNHGVMEDYHKDCLVGASKYQMNHEEVEKDEFLRQNGIRMVPVPEIDLFSDDDDEEEDEVKPAMNSDMNDNFMEDGFNSFKETEIPSWVCDDFKNVDLKTGFQIRPTFYVSMRSKKTQLADEAKENPQAPPPPVGDSMLAPASLPSKKTSKQKKKSTLLDCAPASRPRSPTTTMTMRRGTFQQTAGWSTWSAPPGRRLRR